MRLGFLCAIALSMVSFGAMALDEASWSSDIEAAQAQAAKDGKDVLILFTGSDWCPYCIKMADEIFSTKEFLDGVKGDFILVVVDFPQKKKLPIGQATKNAATSAKYGVSGFPTVVFVGKDGDVYSIQAGYLNVGAKKYLETIKLAREAHAHAQELLESAKKIEHGTQRALFENAALQILTKSGVFCTGKCFGYDEVIKDIISSDPDNKANMRITWDYFDMAIKARAAFDEERYKDVLSLVDGFLKVYPSNDSLQQLCLIKAATYEKLMDRDHEAEMLNKVIAIDATTEFGLAATAILDELNGKQGDNAK